MNNGNGRPKTNNTRSRGLFGAIGGIARRVGGAAKHVAAGTVHHASQVVKAVAPHVKVGVRLNVGRTKKIPKMNISSNNNRERKAFNAGYGKISQP